MANKVGFFSGNGSCKGKVRMVGVCLGYQKTRFLDSDPRSLRLDSTLTS